MYKKTWLVGVLPLPVKTGGAAEVRGQWPELGAGTGAGGRAGLGAGL